MNRYFKEFLHRGLMFGGFGPIIVGAVYFILSQNIKEFELEATQVFIAILSGYTLAFVHAGSSIYNQIEHWSLMKSLLCQLGTLYIVYVGGYLANRWIPFDVRVIAIFTGIFIVGYLVIWAIVYLCVKNSAKKLSKKIV